MPQKSNASVANTMKHKKIKKSLIRKDSRGEFIYRHYFVGGRQKLKKIYLFNGVPLDEIDTHAYYLEMADEITLLQDGEYEEIERRNSSYKNDKIISTSDEEIPF